MDKELATIYALLMDAYGIPQDKALKFFLWVNTSILLFRDSFKIKT